MPHGLYPQEEVLGNHFEVDVDITLPGAQPWPYVDYTLVHKVATGIFRQREQLLETIVYNMHTALKTLVPAALTIKVAVRKMRPPMNGETAYAQVCYEA